MDVPLYAVALAVFAILYLAVSAFLIWAILVSLIFMFIFLALRYGDVSTDYPHSAADVCITAIFIGVTWGIFVFVGPKNPVPWIGSGFTYQAANTVPVGSILAITVGLLLTFLIVFSLASERLAEARMGQASGGKAPPSAQAKVGGS